VDHKEPSSRQILAVYLASGGLFTLAASLIWGVNTLFLLNAGLDIFQVMLVNATFSAGQVLFEVPTGVVADTIGRKASYLLGIGTLLIATLLYVASAEYGWGIWAFVGASVLLGFGFTCQTGAVDAWLVDALNYLKYEGLHEQVFARAGMVSGAAMLIGTLAGGFLGQVNLSVPYLVRSGILALAFVFVAVGMHEVGFRPRPLRWDNFGSETRTIFNAGIQYGWRHRVVRPLLVERHLANIADNLQLIADLGYGDVALAAVAPDRALVVVADARPVTAVAALAASRVGETLAPDAELEAYRALETGEHQHGERRRITRGISYTTSACPIGPPDAPYAVAVRNVAEQVLEAPGTHGDAVHAGCRGTPLGTLCAAT
jgi:MFS family permease